MKRALRIAALLCAAHGPVVALAAHSQGNPASAPDLARALAAHPYFSRLQLERDASHPPFLFLLQRVTGAPPLRNQRVVEELAPFLFGTRALFEERVARPAKLELRAGHECLPVIVLASQNDIQNYQSATGAGGEADVWAFHDLALNACVLYHSDLGQERPLLERACAARHVLLHACQVAWSPVGAKPELHGWFLEGMADALANASADGNHIRLDPGVLRQTVVDMQDEHARFASLRTLEEMFFVGDPSRLELFFRTRTPKELQPLRPKDWRTFHRQGWFLFAYLWSGEDARHRPGLVSFAGDSLRGLQTSARFQERLRPASVAELEHGFVNWLVTEHKKAFPLEKVDEEKAALALARGGAAGYAPPPVPLDLADATPEERLALAIHRLSRGEENAAALALSALAGESLEPELQERVQRERRRLELWRERRDAYLRGLVGSSTPLAFRADGKLYKVKVVGFAPGEVALEANRSGRERLSVEDLDPLELAQEMPRGGTDDWARLLPYVLRGDARARKLLKDAGGGGAALLADALGDYPARLELGRVLARIEEVGRAELPDTPADVEILLTELRALREERGQPALLARKAPALLSRARTLLDRKYSLLGDAGSLAGKLEVLDGGRVRITYAFDDPAELADFDAKPYPVLVSKGFPELGVPDVPFAVTDGELTASGHATLRSLFELAPPLAVSYGVGFARVEPEADLPKYLFLFLAVADDRQEHFVWGQFQSLQIFDAEYSDIVNGPDFPFYLDTIYAMKLRHDGARVFLACEDREVSIAAGGRKNGALFLFAHTANPARIPELVVEGKLLPNSLAGLRKARIERELAGF